MRDRGAAGQPGILLSSYLQTGDEAEARRDLERLVREHADPIIRAILRRKWRASPHATGEHTIGPYPQESEDLHREAVAHLLARLYDLRRNGGTETIHDFPAYVAVTTYRVLDGHLRRKHPRWWSLKNRLRYLLSHQEGLAIWTDERGHRLAGFAVWQDRAPRDRSGTVARLRDDPTTLARAAVGGEDAGQLSPADLLAAIFNHLGAPIELDDLVTLVGELWGLKEPWACVEPATPTTLDRTEGIPDSGPSVMDRVGQRDYLQHLWAEIRLLPPRQATALLLNLRDAEGRGGIALLPLMGVATLRQIAEALAMPADQFAAMWNDLPLDDAAIAGHLRVTRQQVINLRKVARERLARRMKAAGLEAVIGKPTDR